LQNKKKHFITSPLSLRFSKISNGTICIANQINPCAWIEQPLLNFNKTHEKLWHTLIGETLGERDTYEDVFNLLLGHHFKGIVHWGLWFDVKPSVWNNIHPDDFQSFVNNYKFFNSQQYFCNDFTLQSGLDSIAFPNADSLQSKKKAL